MKYFNLTFCLCELHTNNVTFVPQNMCTKCYICFINYSECVKPCITLRDVGNSILRFWTTTCHEILIDVHKLLWMCIVLKALHTINVCFSGKYASRTCRFNHSSCISKNRPFSETKKVFAAFHFASHSFGTTSNIL